MPAAEDDRLLEEELRAVLGRAAPLPDRVIWAAKESFTWRTAAAELAELTADSLLDGPVAAVRGEPQARTLTFGTGELTIEVEVTAAGPRRRMLGQLVPPQPATIEVCQPQAIRTVEADQLGRFAVDNLAAEPVSLRCHLPERPAVTTEWVTV